MGGVTTSSRLPLFTAIFFEKWYENYLSLGNSICKKIFKKNLIHT